MKSLGECLARIVKDWKEPCAPKLAPQKKLLAELDTAVDPEDRADPVTKKADIDRLWDYDREHGRGRILDSEETERIAVRLRDDGNTIVVIEHNLDVIKTADWIVDMGPEGGDGGGRIIATGTPRDIANTNGSSTGQFLRKILQ